MTDLLGHDEKGVSDKNMITSHQRHMEGKRDYCSHFSMTFETTGSFLIDFVRYILGKKRGLTELPGHDRKLTSDMSFISKNILKRFRIQIEILSAVFD